MSPPLIQWNLPNQITVFRLVISLLVFILIPLGYYVPALVAFSIAAGTDWLDGYLAQTQRDHATGPHPGPVRR